MLLKHLTLMRPVAIGCGILLRTMAPLHAAPPPSEGTGAPANPDIVIQARRDRAIRDFVRSMTDPDKSRQLGRWDTEVCPTVVGIEPAQTSFMENRIGQVARSVGLKARSGGCLTTMLVIVDNDAAGVASALAKRYPISLRADGQWRLDRFVRTKQPVRWLSVTNPCGFSGCSLPNSRLSSAEEPAFQAMIVVVDGRKIGAISLAQLSDYVAFISLANPPMNGRRSAGSIMALFDGPEADKTAARLTDDDVTFLHGLYETRPSALGRAQRSSIVTQMKRHKPGYPEP